MSKNLFVGLLVEQESFYRPDALVVVQALYRVINNLIITITTKQLPNNNYVKRL